MQGLGGLYNAANIAFGYLFYIVASSWFLLDNAGTRASWGIQNRASAK
jgi:hypothetical protein